MKPFFQKLPRSFEKSFDLIEFKSEALSFPLHFHPQMEMIFFKSYHGSMLIGNTVFEPNAGDILLIGSNVPHCNLGYEPIKGCIDEGVVAIFDLEIFGASFWEMHEMSAVHDFLTSASGVKLYRSKDIAALLTKELAQLNQKRPSRQTIHLLSVLETLAHHASEAHELLKTPFISFRTGKQEERINHVYQYLSMNFKRQVKLDEIANEIHMSSEAACRYFKKATGRTIFSLLLEFRIHHAKNKLSEEGNGITQIALESGFTNLSTFNRCFLKEVGMTPRDYRKSSISKQHHFES